jgi:hypothetical protein
MDAASKPFCRLILCKNLADGVGGGNDPGRLAGDGQFAMTGLDFDKSCRSSQRRF